MVVLLSSILYTNILYASTFFGGILRDIELMVMLLSIMLYTNIFYPSAFFGGI